jgi:hypothetical protein
VLILSWIPSSSESNPIIVNSNPTFPISMDYIILHKHCLIPCGMCVTSFGVLYDNYYFMGKLLHS